VTEIIKVLDKGPLLEVNGKYQAYTHSTKKSKILNKQKNLTLKMLFDEVIKNQKEESWDPNIHHNENNIYWYIQFCIMVTNRHNTTTVNM